MERSFAKAARLDELDEGELKPVSIEDLSIVLAKVGEQVYAFDSLCTHGYGYLEEGFLDGCEVYCPLHGGAFDIRTGEPSREPCSEPIRTYPIRIEGGDVYVDIGPA